MISRHADIYGMKFGNLSAISVILGRPRIMWLCKCECGKHTVVFAGNLKSGHTKSCGCKKSRPIHGKHNTNTYFVWVNMKARCDRKNHKEYRNYGGRGITYCEEWKCFSAFLNDMGEAKNGESLDRINNDLGYFKENCRWTNQHQQARNKRNNVNATINGETKCLKDWAKSFEISYQTVQTRRRLGWDIEKAVTTPVKRCCLDVATTERAYLLMTGQASDLE